MKYVGQALLTGSIVAMLAMLSFLPLASLAQIPVTISNITVTPSDSTAKIVFTTNLATGARIDFGLTDQYGFYIESGLSPRTDHEITLVTLKPETTYHYRIRANGKELSALTSDRTFKTLKEGKEGQPEIESVSMAYITATTATFQITTSENTSATVRIGRQAGTYTTASRGSGGGKKIHDVTVSGLTVSTGYHAQVEVKDEDGNITKSNDIEFRTTGTSDPERLLLVVSDVNAVSVGATQAAIVWKTNKLSEGWVQYGEKDTSLRSRANQVGFRTFEHRVELVGLKPSTRYYLTANSKDVFGKSDPSDVISFVTAATNDVLITESIPDSGMRFYARYDSVADADVALGSETGTVSGIVSINSAAGKNGGAARLGTKSEIRYADARAVSLSEGTISFWVRPAWTSYATDHILLYLTDTRTGKTDKEFRLGTLAQGRSKTPLLQWFAENARDQDFKIEADARSLAPNKWHHVALVWQYGGKATLWIDGVSWGEVALTGDAPADLLAFSIGRATSDTDAQFDDVVVYGRMLSETQVAVLAETGPVGLEREQVRVLGVSYEPVTRPTRIIRASGDSKIYAVINGMKYHIPSEASLRAFGYNWGDVQTVSPADVARLPRLRLVKPSDSNNVYYLYERNGRLYSWHIPSPEVFSSYPANRWSDVVTIPVADFSAFGTVTLVKSASAPTVYLIENGQKRPIASESVFFARGFRFNDVAVISDLNLSVIPTGSPLQ